MHRSPSRPPARAFAVFVPSLAAVLPILALAAVPASAADPCSPGPEARGVLAEVEALKAACGRAPGCTDEQLALLEAALAERPDDVHLHRAYQNAARTAGGEEARKALQERYRERAEAEPATAADLYLYGRLLSDADEELPLYARAVEAEPGFPWSHLSLAALAARSREDGAGAGDAAPHLRRFLELCPERGDAVAAFAPQLADRELFAAAAGRIRAAEIGHRFPDYPQVWQGEFALAAPEEHAAVRERIAGDLEGIEALGLEGDARWWRTLRSGHELTGAFERIEEIGRELEARWPCSDQALERRMESVEEPDPGAPQEEIAAVAEAAWRRAGEWLEQCPDQFFLHLIRFGALERLPDLPDDEALAAADAFLASWETARGWVQTYPSPEQRAARLYLDRGLRVERVSGLLDRAMAAAEERIAGLRERKDLPAAMLERFETNHRYTLSEYRTLRAEALSALGRPGEAEAILGELRAELPEWAPEGEDPDPEAERRHRDRQAALWRLAAVLARDAGRPLDAAAFYLAAHAAAPKKGEDLERARQLWLEAGGTEAGWQALTDPAAGGVEADGRFAELSDWQRKEEPLGPFELADLAGERWRLADLRGKRVFVNVWATWCGPCRRELPWVEELHRRLAGREDAVLVTLNMDYNPGLVAPYLSKNGYTFPVLLAQRWLDEEFREGFGIPRNWVLDGGGTIRWEQTGFDQSLPQEEWLAAALERLAAEGL
ncbi:MAG TPA: TlpA disulfide reductase family protein [Thermoanaerobaculia bacterium]|nr:TlpA disulfide reductase family protein [Thermoanaerobaculia bacterium]